MSIILRNERVTKTDAIIHQIDHSDSAPRITIPSHVPLVDHFYSPSVFTDLRSSNSLGSIAAEMDVDDDACDGDLDFQSIDLFHTRYHAIPKLELLQPLAAKW